MAIVIEEEKRKSGGQPLVAAGWVVVLIILVIAGYYLFLAPAPAALITPPTGFQALQPISQISAFPEDVASGTLFEMLRPSAPEPATSSPANVGRANPFVPPQ
jgi:hypothetical protein